MIYDHFRATVACDAPQDRSDLFHVSLHGGDIQDQDTRWDQPLFSAIEIPRENVLESLYKMKMRDSVQLQSVLAVYDLEIDRNLALPSYQ